MPLGVTRVEVECQKRTFPIHLGYNKNLLTVYQAFQPSDGIIKVKKKLSARKRFEKSLRKQTGLVITDWKWDHTKKKRKGRSEKKKTNMDVRTEEPQND